MSEPAGAPRPKRMAIVFAAGLYFLLVFAAGLVLGPVRVMWLEPWLGTTLAVLCEAPLLIAVMWFAARAAPALAKLEGGWLDFLALGIIALVLQQIADLAVGFGLRGMTLAEQGAYFTSPAGMIYLVALVIFALTPMIRRLRLRQA